MNQEFVKSFVDSKLPGDMYSKIDVHAKEGELLKVVEVIISCLCNLLQTGLCHNTSTVKQPQASVQMMYNTTINSTIGCVQTLASVVQQHHHCNNSNSSSVGVPPHQQTVVVHVVLTLNTTQVLWPVGVGVMAYFGIFQLFFKISCWLFWLYIFLPYDCWWSFWHCSW